MSLRRIGILAAAVAATSLFGGTATTQTLRVAPHSDLKVVDPVWTTALISVNHGYMIYDTLFALDEKLVVRPQMVVMRSARTSWYGPSPCATVSPGTTASR